MTFLFYRQKFVARGNDFKVSKPLINQNKYRNLFSCRDINCWNSVASPRGEWRGPDPPTSVQTPLGISANPLKSFFYI